MSSKVSATPGTSSMSKRPRDDEDAAVVADTETNQEDPSRAPVSKKVRIIQRVGPEVRRGSLYRNLNRLLERNRQFHTLSGTELFFPGGGVGRGQY